MDHPSDFLTITGMGVDVTLMRFLRRPLWDLLNYLFIAGRLEKLRLLFTIYFSSSG
jgi:hypothetical protein